MKKNKKNSNTALAEEKYTLTKKDLKGIESDAETVLKMTKQFWGSKDEVRIQWTVFSKDLPRINSYQEFLIDNFSKTFDFEFYIDQRINSDRTSQLAVVLECFPVNREKIIEVAKFVYTTAKSMGCNYVQTFLDILPEDDPRFQY
jgi:hypothetical protein